MTKAYEDKVVLVTIELADFMVDALAQEFTNADALDEEVEGHLVEALAGGSFISNRKQHAKLQSTVKDQAGGSRALILL